TKIAQESPIQSWKRIRPSVVSASKSGAVSPIFICFPPLFYYGDGFAKFRGKSQYWRGDGDDSWLAVNSQNLLRSMLPPEMIATTGPLRAFPPKAAARGNAPAPSEITRDFSAMSRIAFLVSSRLTMK